MSEMGRPSTYTPELAAKLCAELSEGKSLRTVCKSNDMPDKSTVFRWLSNENTEEWAKDFRDQYARAKVESADAQFEELNDVAEDAIIDAKRVDPKASNAVVQAHRLKADNLKWAMSKLKPKKYGDKLDLTSGGDKIQNAPLVVSNIRSRNEDGTSETKQEATTGS